MKKKKDLRKHFIQGLCEYFFNAASIDVSTKLEPMECYIPNRNVKFS